MERGDRSPSSSCHVLAQDCAGPARKVRGTVLRATRVYAALRPGARYPSAAGAAEEQLLAYQAANG